MKGESGLFLVTYKKSNGDIFCRLNTSYPTKRIGGTTSMGWTVVDIHEEYNGNYYHEEVLHKIIHEKVTKNTYDYKMIKTAFIKLIIKKLEKHM